jgi:CheY-like chemotaxis protein
MSTMNGQDNGVRVMVVDDLPDLCEALVLHLELDGYEVQSANSAAEAMALVARFNPHCVLLDVHMPGVDGLELARTLRRQYGDDIVLVAVTGHPPTDRRVADAFVLVDHYLQKPIDLEQLRKVLPNLAA